MKAQERHHLKQNEFAVTTARRAGGIAQNRDRIVIGVGAVILVAAIAGGYFYLQKQSNDRAGAALGAALRVGQSPIVPAPTLPGATQQAGTFSTEQARNEAAVAAYQKVIDAYPNHDAGMAARYHLAGFYLATCRASDAATAYGLLDTNSGVARRATFVVDKAGVVRKVDVGREALDPSGVVGMCKTLDTQ